MNNVRFIRKAGRIIPIIKKAVGDIKNIKYASAKIKPFNVKKAEKVAMKIDASISAKKMFLSDSASTMSQERIGLMRKSIQRNRDRYFKVKFGAEDAIQNQKNLTLLKESGQRGKKIVKRAAIGLGASTAIGTGSYMALNRKKR